MRRYRFNQVAFSMVRLLEMDPSLSQTLVTCQGSKRLKSCFLRSSHRLEKHQPVAHARRFEPRVPRDPWVRTHLRSSSTFPNEIPVNALMNFAVGAPLDKEDRSHIREWVVAHDMSFTPKNAIQLLQQAGLVDDSYDLGMPEPILPQTFESELEHDAARLSDACPDHDCHYRKDLTTLPAFTIDDVTTTDIDDGLSIEKHEDKDAYRVWIHVADPTRWIATPKEPLAQEACRRGRTLYLPHVKIPMFPSSVSAGTFSLISGKNRCALTIECVVHADGTLDQDSIQIMPSTVRTQRLTYDMVDSVLKERMEIPMRVHLEMLQYVAKARKQWRELQGSVMLQLPEPSVEVDPRTKQVSIKVKSVTEWSSRDIVAEMMILAGEVFSKFGEKHGIPLPYRGQEMPIVPDADELQRIPDGISRVAHMRKYMLRSITVAEGPQRHAAIGVDGYVQATSPIRRYGDMLAHWQVKSWLRENKPMYTSEELQYTLDTLNRTHQRLTRYERDVSNYWVARFFQQQKEAQPNKTWRAQLVRWIRQEFSIASVYIHDIGLEVVARLDRPAQVGNMVTLRCTEADPETRTFQLSDSSY